MQTSDKPVSVKSRLPRANIFLNARYIIRLVLAFVMRFRVLIGVSFGFGIVFFFILKFILPILIGSSTERIGITGRYNTSNLPNEILELIGDGLTKLDTTGNVEPNLAETWQTTDKGKTWIFTLKKDVKWQDGKAVVASEILYQFSDVTIEHPDERTITFKLQNPYSAFPAVVSRPTFKKGLLGTGEWEVKQITLSGTYVSQMTIEKKSEKTKSKKIYKFYPTEERTKLAFQLGEVDEITGVLDPTPFDSWKRVKMSSVSNTGEYVAVFFNTQDKVLAEKNVRQALSYAINKEDLGGMRAISPISADSWAYNSQVKPYNYDIEKAKGIINDLKKESKQEVISVNLATPPLLLPKAEKIAKDWRAIGVEVNIEVAASVPQEYQAFLAIFDIPDDPDQYSIWHSTQTATNLTKYQNPRIDKLLEDGRSEIDLENRRKIYLDFQRFLVEDSPAAFLYYPTIYTIKRS